jgi:hypothetical protein
MTSEKNQAELEIEALADIFGIATTGFEEFYKKTKDSAEGDYSTAASSGDHSTAASSGDHSTAASSGDYSKAASSGYYSTAASSGDYSKAASSGDYSACTAVGYRATVKGEIGNLIMASEYIIKDGEYIPIGGKADIVDGKDIKPDCWYIVEKGKWVEVDFADGIFGRVISRRKNIKKIKVDSGDIVFVVSEDGVSAHGKTAKEALAELSFKKMTKDVEQFRGMSGDTIKTPEEWGVIYRAITGACKVGVEMFKQSKDKIKGKYTLSEILEETEGAYGYEKFKSVVKSA